MECACRSQHRRRWCRYSQQVPSKVCLIDISHLPNINIQRLEDWMDEEYPDIFIPHDKLAKKILQLIRSTPSEYRIIMPFSEMARFYDNKYKLEFDALISTIKGFDTGKEGFKHKQRIYIPIVGQEGKMQHFRDDSQSFIWYYHNSDRQLFHYTFP